MTRSVKSMRSSSVGSPRTWRMRRHTASSPSPGGTRQSIRTWAREGMTFILLEALAMVGVSVTPSIGSTTVRSRGSRSEICARAADGSSGS